MESEGLDRLVRGDPASWNAFVERYSGWILRVARATLRRATGRDADAEDVVSDVFRQLLERDHALLKSLRPPYHLKAWLAVIARRACLSRFKRKNPPPREKPTADESPALGEFLARLPLRERALLELFFVHQCSYEEISEILGVGVDSIGQLKFRALEKLREMLGKRPNA